MDIIFGFIGMVIIIVAGYYGIRGLKYLFVDVIAENIKKSKHKKIEKEKLTIKIFTKNVIEEFPKEVISMAYYFVNENLKLTKVTEGTEEQTKSGKVIVSTNILNNIIEIPNDIPGKLLEINKDNIKIQFGSDADKSLVFEITEKNEFKLKTKDKLMVSYDKSEYKADKEPIILFKLQKNISEKTVSRKETGAW